jgi:hypothetical protein
LNGILNRNVSIPVISIAASAGSRVIARVEVWNAKRPDHRYLADVLGEDRPEADRTYMLVLDHR